MRANTLVKWLWSAKPQTRATYDDLGSRKRSIARSTRRRKSHRCGDVPFDCRKARAKWLTVVPTIGLAALCDAQAMNATIEARRQYRCGT
jgi:hypothetical protein